MDKSDILTAIAAKDTCNAQLNKLSDYYRGQHDILYRTLSDPLKPNNRIVANYCGLIADFFNSYLLGVPVKYVSQNEPLLTEIQGIFNYNDEAEHNIAVGENMNIFGYGAEILYIDDKQRRIELITNVLRLKNPSIGDYRDVTPVFQRNFIMDDRADRAQALAEIGTGVMSAAEYRVRFYGETIEEATKAAAIAARGTIADSDLDFFGGNDSE